MTTQHLGVLEGQILVFGGTYGNLQALKQMRQIARDLGISKTNIIHTGDAVAYCAQPEECVQLLADWGVHSIAGNVEIQLREGEEDCGCNFKSDGRCDVFSRQWYPFVQNQLSEQSLKWMDILPDFLLFNYANLRVVVLHGSWNETAEFIFSSTDWNIKAANFEEAQADVLLAGHCGLPFSQEKKGKYWLNAGVIGMPANDGTPRVWYLLLNGVIDGQLQYEHHSFEYDHQQAAKLMKQNGLPQTYARTLGSGIWDNCEILPPKEASLQGKLLRF